MALAQGHQELQRSDGQYHPSGESRSPEILYYLLFIAFRLAQLQDSPSRLTILSLEGRKRQETENEPTASFASTPCGLWNE